MECKINTGIRRKIIYGKDSERYELNKDKFTTLLEEGGMNYYD